MKIKTSSQINLEMKHGTFSAYLDIDTWLGLPYQ